MFCFCPFDREFFRVERVNYITRAAKRQILHTSHGYILNVH